MTGSVTIKVIAQNLDMGLSLINYIGLLVFYESEAQSMNLGEA